MTRQLTSSARRARTLLILPALVTLPAFATTSRAAPQPVVEAPATANLESAQSLIDLGYERKEEGELKAAIQLWEQAYQLLPPERRGELQPPLAHLYFETYQKFGTQEDLRRAHELNLEHYAQADASDGVALEAAEEAVAETERELDRLATEEERRQKAALEQAAGEAIAQERATQQQDEFDRRIREQEARLAEQERALDLSRAKRDRRLLVAGGSLAGLGLAGVATMAASLGVAEDRYGELRDDYFPSGEFPEDPMYTSEAATGFLAQRQSIENLELAAIISGVSGGVLLITGVALLVSPIKKHSAARIDTNVRLRGLVLKF